MSKTLEIEAVRLRARRTRLLMGTTPNTQATQVSRTLAARLKELGGGYDSDGGEIARAYRVWLDAIEVRDRVFPKMGDREYGW